MAFAACATEPTQQDFAHQGIAPAQYRRDWAACKMETANYMAASSGYGNGSAYLTTCMESKGYTPK